MKYAPEYAFIGNIVGGRKGDGIAAGVAAGGTLSGMGPDPSNLNPRYEAGHMLGHVLSDSSRMLPNGKRFYCETAVHNAATRLPCTPATTSGTASGTTRRRTASIKRSSPHAGDARADRELARGTGRKAWACTSRP